MRKFLLAILLMLGMANAVYADGMNSAVGPTTINPRWTVSVFNDNGSAITSGSVVAWDDDDTDFSTSNYPYITTTTTADDPYTAGVMLTGSCADQTVCEISVYGPTMTRIADSTDNATVDTLVGATTVAGQAGDYATGADTCALGTLVDFDGGDGVDNALGTVFVNINCD